MDGVHSATFSHENAEGFVTFDSTATSVPEIIDHLHGRTGYGATLRRQQQEAGR